MEQVVVSKSPLRRLRSEIPHLEDFRKRSNSIVPKIPIFTNIMKS